jgi:hypothetical protein
MYGLQCGVKAFMEKQYKDVYVYCVVILSTTEQKSEVGPRQTYVVGNFYFHNGGNQRQQSKVKALDLGEVPITISKAMSQGHTIAASNEMGEAGVTTNDE